MKLKPIFTEKSMMEAKNGKYSFWVDTKVNKNQIKLAVNTAFGVNVTSVHTVNMKEVIRRTISGKFVRTAPRKKAIVSLKDKQTIDLFEDKSEGKKGKKSK